MDCVIQCGFRCSVSSAQALDADLTFRTGWSSLCIESRTYGSAFSAALITYGSVFSAALRTYGSAFSAALRIYGSDISDGILDVGILIAMAEKDTASKVRRLGECILPTSADNRVSKSLVDMGIRLDL